MFYVCVLTGEDISFYFCITLEFAIIMGWDILVTSQLGQYSFKESLDKGIPRYQMFHP